MFKKLFKAYIVKKILEKLMKKYSRKKTLLSLIILSLPLTNLMAVNSTKPTVVKKNVAVAQADSTQKLQNTPDTTTGGGFANEPTTPTTPKTTPVPNTGDTGADDTIYNSYILDQQRYDKHDPNADPEPIINDTNYSSPKGRPYN